MLGSSPAPQLKSICNLSVLVITYPGKWNEAEFKPSHLSRRKIDWFEGTGTVVGIKRNRIFILSAIHFVPEGYFSFFVKGEITGQIQVSATLCVNHFVEENNGIDIAVFSCDIAQFDRSLLSSISNIQWKSITTFEKDSPVWLVHYPTSCDENVPSDSRLINPVFPTISQGILVSIDLSTLTFDSTIVGTGGSSGGIIIDGNGYALGVHDSQHDDTPTKELISTHRMIKEVKETLSTMRQLQDMIIISS